MYYTDYPEYRVKCTNCEKEFFEKEIIYNEEENEEYCPFCGEGGCLKDLDYDPTKD